MHHLLALREIEVHHLYAMGEHEMHGRRGALGLANHNLLYAKLNHSPGAEIAGHEGRVERGIMIAAGEAGMTQAVHFGVHELILVLHPPVSAPSDYPALLHKYGTDGNSTL